LVITNSIIFTYVRRSTRRVQPANGENAQASTLSDRDARLLKHMIFMFVVFACGWAPVYIEKMVDVSGTAVSPVAAQIFLLIPAVALLIDVADLFFYNHELRKYFTNKRQMDQITLTIERTRERTRE
jgi:hypothetical protein